MGTNADPALVRSLSCEKQVTAQTPPTFLWHTDEDKWVPPENSVQFYLALRRAQVSGELHVFKSGNHGDGLFPGAPGTTACRLDSMKDWMQAQGLLKVKKSLPPSDSAQSNGKP